MTEIRPAPTDLVGPSYRFAAAVRALVADGAGQSLGAAADHGHRSRAPARPARIGEQFELDQFLRDRRRDHPPRHLDRGAGGVAGAPGPARGGRGGAGVSAAR